MRTNALILLLAVAAGCVSVPDDYLVRRVNTHAEAVAIFTQVLPDTPDDLLKDLRPWFDAEWAKLEARLGLQDEVWYFKEPKGGMGFRHGFAVVHAGKRISEFTVLDDN